MKKTKQKQICQQLAEILAVIPLLAFAVLLVDTSPVLAQVLSLPSSSSYSLPAPQGTGAVAMTKSIVDMILKNARLIIGIIAVFMIVLVGFRMVIAQGNEDDITKQKSAITFAIIGMAFIALSTELGKVFSLEGGSFLSDPKTILQRSGLFNNQVKIVITFIKYIIGSIAVLSLIHSGFTLIRIGSEEDKVTEVKKHLQWSAIGLALIILADTVINKVLFKVDTSKLPGSAGSDPTLAVGRGISEIVGFTNYALAIVGPVLILTFIVGGIMYVTARGEEEQMNKAKKIFIASAIGMVIIYGAFALVSTLLTGRFG